MTAKDDLTGRAEMAGVDKLSATITGVVSFAAPSRTGLRRPICLDLEVHPVLQFPHSLAAPDRVEQGFQLGLKVRDFITIVLRLGHGSSHS